MVNRTAVLDQLGKMIKHFEHQIGVNNNYIKTKTTQIQQLEHSINKLKVDNEGYARGRDALIKEKAALQKEMGWEVE